MNLVATSKLMSRTLVTFMVPVVLALGMTSCGEKTASDNAKAAGDAVGDAARTAGDAVGDAARTAGDAVDNAAEKTGDAVGDAMDATDTFLAQSKDADVRAARETLDRIEKQWNDLVVGTAPGTAEARAEFQNTREQMARALAEARARLVEADNAHGDNWQQTVKPRLYAALQKTQDLYDEAYTRFGKK